MNPPLYRIAAIGSCTLAFKRADEYLDCIVTLVRYLEDSEVEFCHPPFRSAVLKFLTGRHTGRSVPFAMVQIVPELLEDLLASGELCQCEGVARIHTPDTSGCLSDEPGPFCGKCGMPCTPKVHTWKEKEEFWGAPAYRTEAEIRSDCCNAEDLYDDANLTKDSEEPSWIYT